MPKPKTDSNSSESAKLQRTINGLLQRIAQLERELKAANSKHVEYDSGLLEKHRMYCACKDAVGRSVARYAASLADPFGVTGARNPFNNSFKRTRTIPLKVSFSIITGTAGIGYVQFDPMYASVFAPDILAYAGPASDKTIGNYSTGTWAGSAIPSATATGISAIAGWPTSPWTAAEMTPTNLTFRCVSAAIKAKNTTKRVDQGGYGYAIQFPDHIGANWTEAEFSAYTRTLDFDYSDKPVITWTPKKDMEQVLAVSGAAASFINSGMAMMFSAPAGTPQTWRIKLIANYECAGRLAGGKQKIHHNPTGAAAVSTAVSDRLVEGYKSGAGKAVDEILSRTVVALGDMGAIAGRAVVSEAGSLLKTALSL